MSDEKREPMPAPPSPAVPEQEQPADAAASRDEPKPVAAAPDPEAVARWNEYVRRQMRRQSRRAFLTFGGAGVAGLAAWRWLATRPDDEGIPWPLRRALEATERVERALLPPRRLTADRRGRALEDRVNGGLGLADPIDPAAWRLELRGLAGRTTPLPLTLDAIRSLRRAELTAEFKCIEGWSVVVAWTGVRYRDFLAAYPPATRSGAPLDLVGRPADLPPYAGMATPGGDYYVGMDMSSLLHPQTLLAYEMNGAPLTQDHGAPLRLVVPVKYGVKNIKRLGTIRYGYRRPADYWAEQGYDWYCGL